MADSEVISAVARAARAAEGIPRVLEASPSPGSRVVRGCSPTSTARSSAFPESELFAEPGGSPPRVRFTRRELEVLPEDRKMRGYPWDAVGAGVSAAGTPVAGFASAGLCSGRS